jgi:hypothetical protein
MERGQTRNFFSSICRCQSGSLLKSFPAKLTLAAGAILPWLPPGFPWLSIIGGVSPDRGKAESG